MRNLAANIRGGGGGFVCGGVMRVVGVVKGGSGGVGWQWRTQEFCWGGLNKFS